MTAHAMRVVEAMKLRAQQIISGDGSPYNTNAGQQVYIGRTQFNRENDAFPLITFGVPRTTPAPINVGMQAYTITADFVAVGYIAVPVDDYAGNPIALQADMELALMRAAPGDLLLPLVEDYRWTGSSIDYSQDTTDFTRVSVQLRASWTETLGATFP